jgi:phage/plasmid-associated DNA primase
MMRNLYGETNFTTLGQTDLDGRFNEKIVDILFVSANEVMSSSNRSAETSNKIKPWVTDEVIPLEGKYATSKVVTNNFNIWFASNDRRPVLIERGDRRFSVFHSTALSPTVGANVYNDIKGSQVQLKAFFAFLLARKTTITWGQRFNTQAHGEIVKASDASDVQFAEAIKEDGWLTVASHWVDSVPNGKIREPTVLNNLVLAETLYEVYQDFCKMHGVKPFTRQRAMRTIREVLPQITNTRQRMGGITPTVWVGLPMQSPDAQVIDMAERKKEMTAAQAAPKVEEKIIDDDNLEVGAEKPET